MKTEISTKVIKGSFWILLLRITNRVLGLARTTILARLLLPEHFGIVAIAVAAIAAIEAFSQPGLAAALIQKQEKITDYLNTAWTASVIRCLLIYAVLYFLSPYVASFFHASEAKNVIQIYGLSTIIAGFRNIGVVYFQKEMEFKKQYLYDLSIILANISVAIPAALILRSVWALVLGGIAGSIVRIMMSYILHPFRPRLRLDKCKLFEMMNFGKWILGSNILYFLITQGDDIFLGKVFGTAALGLYQMAFMISNLPNTDISQVISRVAFPAYSMMQDNISKMRDAYLKVFQIIAFIAIPLSGAIYILSYEFVDLLLTEKWLPIVQIIKVLVWAGLMNTFIFLAEPIFSATGYPNIHTKWQLISLVVLSITIYPLSIFQDFLVVATAVLVSNSTAAIQAY